MIKINCISTGSWGNLYFVNMNAEHFIIEVGTSWTNHRNEVGKCKNIFITHGHSDHMGHLNSLIQNFPNIKVWATKGTLSEFLNNKTTNSKVKILLNKKEVQYNTTYDVTSKIKVTVFQSHHDTLEPSAYLFTDSSTNESLIFITDTGKIPVLPQIPDGKVYAMIEGNYDPKLMYDNSKDRRSASDTGHLSIIETKKFIDDNPHFVWFGLIHGSTTKLGINSDKIFNTYNNVERVYNGWEGYWE